jgi:phage shock protein B
MSRFFQLILMGFGALFLLICFIGVIAMIFAVASPAFHHHFGAQQMGQVPFQYAEPDFAGAAGAVTGSNWRLSFFGILAAASVSVLLIALLLLLLKPRMKSSQSGAMNEQETRIMQEIHHGLSKMEKRIESLETLMLEEHHPADHWKR